MKKLLIILIGVCFILTGCSNEKEDVNDPVKVISPNGAPGLSLVEYVDKYGEENVTIVDGADALQAALLSPNPEFEAVIAPINLGCNLILNKGSEYYLLGVVTWGNLYVVENLDADSKQAAFFGEAAVPGKIVNNIDFDLEDSEVLWYSAVSEASASLLSNDAKYALLAEPVLTATLAKAKQNGVNVEVKYDLQQLYNEKYETKGYPQAALFVSKKSYDENKDRFNDLIDSLKSLSVESMEKLEGNEAFFAVANKDIIVKAFDKMHIEYKEHEEVENEIYKFLQLFNIEYR